MNVGCLLNTQSAVDRLVLCCFTMWFRGDRPNVDQLLDRMLRLENDVGNVQHRVGGLEGRYSYMNNRLDSFGSRMDNFDTSMDNFDTRLGRELQRRMLLQDQSELDVDVPDAAPAATQPSTGGPLPALPPASAPQRGHCSWRTFLPSQPRWPKGRHNTLKRPPTVIDATNLTCTCHIAASTTTTAITATTTTSCRILT